MLEDIWIFLEVVTPYVLSFLCFGIVLLFIYDWLQGSREKERGVGYS